MTTVELERIARSIIPPAGATMAITRVDEQLRHRAAFLIDARIRGPFVGPTFDRPRDAIRLVDLLNGEASRSASQPDLARVKDSTESRDEVVVPSEAPAPQEASTSSASSRCVVCLGSLPPGSRRQRRTCSGACRVALSRGAGGAKRPVADASGSPRVAVTVSAAPAASDGDQGGRLPVPTASAAPRAHRLRGSARDVRPEPGSAGAIGDIPTLGL